MSVRRLLRPGLRGRAACGSDPLRAARRLAAAELAALCDICGGRREGGEVLVEGWTYCSIECAHIARDRTPPGHYFG
ncbi:MAG: hypothetical protein AUI15_16755 [Actinobacteria bacterium 13_2_20CM_2_66_6]|nr:MAG: hypothetical protein AUI15_16755 [Actinobacteria bacterium 13_2_20CM_2_66_6]